MADEDVQVTTATASAAPATGTRTPSRRNADRRTPRFSWNLAYEDTFFRSLCESMQLGYKDSHNFKAGAWERAAVALRDRHGAYPEKSHLINKADNARKKFRMWRGLREDPDFLYNPNTRMVTASEEAWARHFEKEPLSKALRGRPFDHEEYMEILFPDVVGSGGAPKRIMKPRRRNPDGSMPPRPTDVDTATVDPNLDSPTSSTAYNQASSQNQMQPSPQQPPTAPSAQPVQRPTTTTIPPRTSTAASLTALTPPEETAPNTQSRKRTQSDSTPANPEKRRGRPSRFAPSFYNQHSAPAISNSSTGAPSSSTANATQSTPPPSIPAGLVENGILSLAEALKARVAPRWPEQALEIFFREFADEDLDLQLKIAEKALCDENKAMIFVKMSPVLRRHWMTRLREVHIRNLGGGGIGLGRVGDEAS
ncbi:Myb/SANT-like DNA-binding domain-containing protein [Xylaria bambusicola]|uniref:Myb/SANT-like DNA-binding domain-containing protein n=1 Tax=Xylaria bambusicola TaxID=326684 RepID=UPI0020073DAE|nr:Myb/SANT-like DNA-binding domain-containing protein [Xylaria bambusicola]KAI0508853.1 Myb/SANT-like DNA-binding domain-containing protein [Xylaria bambusicola]